MSKILGYFKRRKEFNEKLENNEIDYTSFYADSFKRLRKNKMAMFCMGVIILLALIAIFAPLIAP